MHFNQKFINSYDFTDWVAGGDETLELFVIRVHAATSAGLAGTSAEVGGLPDISRILFSSKSWLSLSAVRKLKS
jgi:hypothetical protein